MESEGTETAPITVSPFLAVIDPPAITFPPNEASPDVKILPFKERSSDTVNTLVVKVFIIALLVYSFTTRFPNMITSFPTTKFPFKDESADTKRRPFKEVSLVFKIGVVKEP